jgi:hypothetical protein
MSTTEMLQMYQRAHLNRWNQVLHWFAFLFAFLGWVFLLINWRMTLLLALLHYTCAWTGHLYFEGNQPAGFKYPFIGFYAGFLWFFLRTAELLTHRRFLPPA